MLCRICITQVQSRKHVLDHAECTDPTRQHELGHTDQDNASSLEYLLLVDRSCVHRLSVRSMCATLLLPTGNLTPLSRADRMYACDVRLCVCLRRLSPAKGTPFTMNECRASVQRRAGGQPWCGHGLNNGPKNGAHRQADSLPHSPTTPVNSIRRPRATIARNTREFYYKHRHPALLTRSLAQTMSIVYVG